MGWGDELALVANPDHPCGGRRDLLPQIVLWFLHVHHGTAHVHTQAK